MGAAPSLEAYTVEVWTAVRALWPNLGTSPAAVVQPYVPVLPAFLGEQHRNGVSAESTALEVLRFFLGIYVQNALGEEERKAQLVDLHAVSKASFEESQRLTVLPFTAALFGAQQTVSGWAAAGRVEPGAARALTRDVLTALLGKPPEEISRLGWLTIEAAGKR